MRISIFNPVVVVALVAAFPACNGFADPAFGVTNSTSQNRMHDSKNSNVQTLDCTKNKADPRCGTSPRPHYPQQHPQYPQQHPHYHPQPYRQRPVIINQLPEEPAIEIDSLSDDWDGCRKAKLGAIKARNSGRASEANNLDEWLWKNCRAYSYELRQLEQDDM